jgi:hypothetical protein
MHQTQIAQMIQKALLLLKISRTKENTKKHKMLPIKWKRMYLYTKGIRELFKSPILSKFWQHLPGSPRIGLHREQSCSLWMARTGEEEGDYMLMAYLPRLKLPTGTKCPSIGPGWYHKPGPTCAETFGPGWCHQPGPKVHHLVPVPALGGKQQPTGTKCPSFSPGWNYKPGPTSGETFGPGWCHKPGLKVLSLVPVPPPNRDLFRRGAFPG